MPVNARCVLRPTPETAVNVVGLDGKNYTRPAPNPERAQPADREYRGASRHARTNQAFVNLVLSWNANIETISMTFGNGFFDLRDVDDDHIADAISRIPEVVSALSRVRRELVAERDRRTP